MKLLGTKFSEDRLELVAPLLNGTIEVLRPLAKIQLPKEREPTTYLRLLSASGYDT